MPSLLRFLAVIAILAGLVYGGLWALVLFVKVTPHEISQPVTLPKPGK